MSGVLAKQFRPPTGRENEQVRIVLFDEPFAPELASVILPALPLRDPLRLVQEILRKRCNLHAIPAGIHNDRFGCVLIPHARAWRLVHRDRLRSRLGMTGMPVPPVTQRASRQIGPRARAPRTLSCASTRRPTSCRPRRSLEQAKLPQLAVAPSLSHLEQPAPRLFMTAHQALQSRFALC